MAGGLAGVVLFVGVVGSVFGFAGIDGEASFGFAGGFIFVVVAGLASAADFAFAESLFGSASGLAAGRARRGAASGGACSGELLVPV